MSKIAYLFPGQGAQTVGMGKQHYETIPAARKLLDDATQILGFDLPSVCFQGSAERLNSTVVSQPAIFVASLAALEGRRSKEPELEKSCGVTEGLS